MLNVEVTKPKRRNTFRVYKTKHCLVTVGSEMDLRIICVSTNVNTYLGARM